MEGWEIALLIIFVLIIITAIILTIYFVYRYEKNNTGNGNGNNGNGNGNGNGNNGNGNGNGNVNNGGCTGGTGSTGCTGITGIGGFTGTIPVVPPGPTGITPLFFNYPGEITGNNRTTNSNVTSLNACQAICLNDVNCTLLSWDSSSNNCYIFETIVNARNNNQNPPTTDIVYESGNRDNFVTWRNSTIYNNDGVNGENVTSLQACFNKCNTASQASGYYPPFMTQYDIKGDGTVDCWCKSTTVHAPSLTSPDPWITSAKATNF
jgi:hypothetical protein